MSDELDKLYNVIDEETRKTREYFGTIEPVLIADDPDFIAEWHDYCGNRRIAVSSVVDKQANITVIMC